MNALHHRRLRSRLAVACCCALVLSGCATAERRMYVDWVTTPEPHTLCEGDADCVQRVVHDGRVLCRIITADREIRYSRLGLRLRECLEAQPPRG